MIYLKLLNESLIFAVRALWSNKLRTFLSLLGVTIGIFMIISVFSLIDSLRNNISDSLGEVLSDDIIYVNKWAWNVGGSSAWWKYINRPYPNLKEYKFLDKKLTKAKAVTFLSKSYVKLEYLGKAAGNVRLRAVSENFNKVQNLKLEKGRYFSPKEEGNGSRVVIIGNTIQEAVFQGTNPIGKTIKLDKQKVTIIGVFEKEGQNMFGNSIDKMVLTPINFFKKWKNINASYLYPEIWVKKSGEATIEELKDDIRRYLRPIRGLKPKDEDNFALNQSSIITKAFAEVFKIIDIAGIIIGSFSILIGAFGIANIMFVSVKERTKIIGIQKALGAKSYFILFQFVFESVFLALMGGIVGLVMVAGLIYFANQMVDMRFTLDITNIVRGIAISFVVGLISGYLPAKRASDLNPVTAINSNF